MKKKTTEIALADERMINKIYIIRGQKVMLDTDLAELYEVDTFRLNESVRRNIERFPKDFMFQLNSEELKSLTSQFAMSNVKPKGRGGRRTLPYAFTEHGILMLSSVLKSEKAVQVNIHIMRIFTKTRELLLTHKDILLKLEQMDKKVSGHDKQIKMLFDYLKQLIDKGDEQPRTVIEGYVKSKK
ncbi:MAG: hypothetical protein RIQ33_213 [Bacteroidota bacterium]|jgi:hypothetical protein